MLLQRMTLFGVVVLLPPASQLWSVFWGGSVCHLVRHCAARAVITERGLCGCSCVACRMFSAVLHSCWQQPPVEVSSCGPAWAARLLLCGMFHSPVAMLAVAHGGPEF